MGNINNIKKNKVNMDEEYIYVREHESYEKYYAIKLGKTTNIPDRESQYITCEIVRGKFIYVYRLFNVNLSQIENLSRGLRDPNQDLIDYEENEVIEEVNEEINNNTQIGFYEY